MSALQVYKILHLLCIRGTTIAFIPFIECTVSALQVYKILHLSGLEVILKRIMYNMYYTCIVLYNYITTTK